ncbi:MAG: DNA-processing protein DprA, partial [Phaeodactylibacter sp.]|nr:DNA-processing protein DprA [Phaeodactylibacter sp.]
KKELLKIPGVGPRIATNLLQKEVLFQAETELKFIESQEIQPIFFLDAEYPYRLRHLPDAPVLLYYKGNTPLNGERIISIVGTRQPSELGLGICEEIVQGLAPFAPVIVSGLAYGIDVTAHRAALRAGLPTIGVLGHGLNRIYPALHRRTALDMQEQGGLLTEYASDTEPDREHFPMRNRIVAGMSDAVIVIETKEQGGSMITARVANQYNKDVFAVPGRINDSRSAGCNLLIKSHLANLIENAQDVLYLLGWEEAEQHKKHGVQMPLFSALDEQEQAIFQCLQDAEDPMHIDRLSRELRLGIAQIATLLLQLEFKGIVKSLPGKRFALSGNPSNTYL